MSAPPSLPPDSGPPSLPPLPPLSSQRSPNDASIGTGVNDASGGNADDGNALSPRDHSNGASKKRGVSVGTTPASTTPISSFWADDVKEMVSQMAAVSSSKKVAKQFKLLSKIGAGSFGAVYEARHESTGCIVAIKCVRGDDDDVQREMQMQQQQQCADIVAYYGHFEKDAQLFLVMELCSVGAVTDLMRVCQCTLNERQIAVVVRGALGALRYMHEKKGVHRDIKTDNILLSSHGEPKLGDFGVSRQLGAGESRMRTIAGTPYFIAPEILSSEQPGYNTKADIWSVGISIIEMAEGHPPYFDEHPMRVLFFIPTKPAPTLQDPGLWSPDMHDFLSLCLLKDPAQRPDAAELLRHAWIASAPDCTEAFGELIAQYNDIIAQYGSRAKALKALKKADGKGDGKESSSSKAEKKKPSSKRDDKRQRRRERREKSRQKHSDDEGGDDDDVGVSGALPPPPPRATGMPPPLPPDAPSVAAKSAPVTATATAVAAVESDDEHSHVSDEASDEGEDVPSNANADEQFVIDYSHGRPLIFDGHREDGRCWFDPRHQVWLSSPEENPEHAKAASDRAPPSAMPPPPPKVASRGAAPPQMSAPGPPPGPPPVISARAANSAGEIVSPRAPRPAVPVAMPVASRTSVGQLLAERPFKFFLPNGTFKTIVAHSNWSVMQLLTAAREKSGLTDQNILLVLRDSASRTRRVFDARERPLLMSEAETAGMAFYIEVAATDGGGAAGGSDKRRGLLSEIRGFALKKKP